MDKLRKVGSTLFITLFLWYSLVFINIHGLLVDGTIDLISLSSLLELLLIIILLTYIFKWKYADLLNSIILSIWGYLQYQANWRYLLFIPSKAILDRYYHFFQGTYRFFPVSNNRIVPDAYHTILGVLILSNLIILFSKFIININSY